MYRFKFWAAVVWMQRPKPLVARRSTRSKKESGDTYSAAGNITDGLSIGECKDGREGNGGE
jgi:hypothetical protein